MLKIKHRMLFGKETEVLDGNIKYKIEVKNRITNKFCVMTKDYREDFEIDNGNCYIKDCKDYENQKGYDGMINLFEIFVEGELWTEVLIVNYSPEGRQILFSDENLFVESDWCYHHYKVYYYGKEMFKNNKKIFSRFHEIEIYNEDYRYQTLALAIAIDRVSHYDGFENKYL